jgi:hypothetical protein
MDGWMDGWMDRQAAERWDTDERMREASPTGQKTVVAGLKQALGVTKEDDLTCWTWYRCFCRNAWPLCALKGTRCRESGAQEQGAEHCLPPATMSPWESHLTPPCASSCQMPP